MYRLVKINKSDAISGGILFLKKRFIYLFRLCQVLHNLHCGTWDLFLVAACGPLNSGMQTLSCGMYAGSSSPNRDRTWAPCIGSVESYPLDHQGNP